MTKFSRVPDHRLDYQQVFVAEQLKRLGVSGLGYVLAANDEELDGRMLDLATFFEQCFGRDDVAIFFPTGNAGCYGNHEGEIFVFSGGA